MSALSNGVCSAMVLLNSVAAMALWLVFVEGGGGGGGGGRGGP